MANNTKPKTMTETVGTKRGRLITLLKRERGASLAEMVEATDWQPHTVRAALNLRMSARAEA